MCLDTITKRPFPSEEEVTRYKILRIRGNKIMFPNRHDFQFQMDFKTLDWPSIEFNTWLEAKQLKEVRCEKDWKTSYLPGFHIFKSLEWAKQALDGIDCTYLRRIDGDVIFEVKAKEIYLEGIQAGIPTEVCSFLKVIKKLPV